MGIVPAGELNALVLKQGPERATESYSGMEIICISCWRAFDHDTSTAAAQVTCPHCGFSQPGPDPSNLNAKLDANTRPSEAATADGELGSDSSSTDPEMPVMEAVEPKPEAPKPPPTAAEPPKRPQTIEYDAVPKEPKAPQAAVVEPKVEPEEPEEPPKPDRRWRLRTPAKLVLYFPDHEAMSRYLTGDEGPGYAVACGPGAFRTLTGFITAMRVTDDPLEALVNVPPSEDDESAAAAAPIPSAPRPRSGARTNTPSAPRPNQKPEANKEPQAASDKGAQSRPRTRRRRTSATSDFSFRKTQEQNPWPGRVLFLMIGLLAGGAAIYYVAWLGLLPGIVY